MKILSLSGLRTGYLYPPNNFSWYLFLLWGTRWCSWFRHRATSRKVVGSFLDGVTENFHWHHPSGHTMTVGSTQPLTEMSTKNISWGLNAVGANGWQPYHLHVPIVLKSGSLNFLETSGPVHDCNGIGLPLHLLISVRGWGWGWVAAIWKCKGNPTYGAGLTHWTVIFGLW
jgi:hypothetical protein